MLKITPMILNQLNKYFKQTASTSNLEKIRTGLPTKEENQYRVKGDNWERLTEDSNQWEQVNDENAINYLNKYYGESVKVKPKTLKDPEPKVNTTIINTDLISKTEEEVVPTLQRNFGKYGFTFTESGLGTDYVKVTSRDGVTKEFSLDERNPEEALRLKSFIEGNKVAIRSAESQRILDLTREATRSDLGIEYRRQKSKELKDYRNSNQFVTDLKNMNFNEVESNINAIKKGLLKILFFFKSFSITLGIVSLLYVSCNHSTSFLESVFPFSVYEIDSFNNSSISQGERPKSRLYLIIVHSLYPNAFINCSIIPSCLKSDKFILLPDTFKESVPISE